MSDRRKLPAKKSLEDLHREVVPAALGEQDWSLVTNLEQPSPYESVDSVGMPGTFVDDTLHAFGGLKNAELE